MVDVLILRLEAPMISFGAPMVDNRGAIQDHPPLSMLTGLIGNALGYRHDEFGKLQQLQERIRFAARCDRPGERFTDYQTPDLGQPFMRRTGWTTRGAREDRRGGKASTETHLRYREYLAGSAYTVGMTLRPPGASPDLDGLEAALERPERPLFIGRKSCLPSVRLLVGRVGAENVLEALRSWPALDPSREPEPLEAWWPGDIRISGEGETLAVTDQRDWANQVHTGQRYLRHGRISVRGSRDD
jgi:CRISPR system Cascade subunit CasD